MHSSFRPLATLLLLALFPAASVSAADLEIVRVFAGWRNAESFSRVGEYFGGKKSGGASLCCARSPLNAPATTGSFA